MFNAVRASAARKVVKFESNDFAVLRGKLEEIKDLSDDIIVAIEGLYR